MLTTAPPTLPEIPVPITYSQVASKQCYLKIFTKVKALHSISLQPMRYIQYTVFAVLRLLGVCLHLVAVCIGMHLSSLT